MDVRFYVSNLAEFLEYARQSDQSTEANMRYQIRERERGREGNKDGESIQLTAHQFHQRKVGEE